MISLAPTLLTPLEKERVKTLRKLDDKTKWRTIHNINKKIELMIDDVQFLLNNSEAIGPVNEIIGIDKIENLIKSLIHDVGLEHSLMTPSFAISIIEENRVLANIIAKKNAVWRDLVAKVNTAKTWEEFVKEITERDNVYLVDGENVRVHIRR